MQLEAKCHEFAYFVTMTYHDAFLPELGTLHPPHLSAFLKRLRARLDDRFPGARLRYSSCGEYGEKERRPHYHVLAYLGSTALNDLEPWRRSDSGELLFRSTLVEQAWGMGHVEIGAVTPASCDYVAGYTLKKQHRGSDAEYLGRVVPGTGEIRQVLPEFARHSTRPGIGAPWFLKWPRDVVGAGGEFGIVLAGGERRSVPGYFLRLLKRSSQLVAQGKPPLPGLEDLEGMEDLIAVARGEVVVKRNAADLRKVNGDRLALAAMHEADRERIAEYRAYMLAQSVRTL